MYTKGSRISWPKKEMINGDQTREMGSLRLNMV